MSLAASLMLVALGSCADAPEPPGPARAFVLTEALISLDESPDGIVALDLDGVSSNGEAETTPAGGCVHEDLVAVDGTEGVDGQLARLGGVVSLFGFGDINAVLQQTIREGALTMLIELDDVHSMMDDPYITARIFRGTGPVDLGSDGRAEPGQSFDIVDAPPVSGVGRIENGELHLTLEGEVNIPLRFAMTYGDIRMSELQVRMQQLGDGQSAGIMGGVVTSSDIEDLVAQAVADGGGIDNEGFLPLLRRVLSGVSDAHADETTGRCAGITAGVAVRAVEAFILRDEAP